MLELVQPCPSQQNLTSKISANRKTDMPLGETETVALYPSICFFNLHECNGDTNAIAIGYWSHYGFGIFSCLDCFMGFFCFLEG